MSQGVLNLKQWLTKDTIGLILQQLCHADWLMIWLAHAPHRQDLLQKGLAEICENCARHGYLSILQWLRDEQRFLIPLHAFNLAAYNGHLHILQWGVPEPAREYDICPFAARNGHLHILQWAATRNDHAWDGNTLSVAVRNGHLQVAKWLQENGCPISDYLYHYAIESDQLDVFKWVIEESGKNWERCYEAMCESAVWANNLDMLQYLLNNYRLPLPSCSLCVIATAHGHLEMLQWLRLNLPGDWNWRLCYEKAERNHRPAIVEWLLLIKPT